MVRRRLESPPARPTRPRGGIRRRTSRRGRAASARPEPRPRDEAWLPTGAPRSRRGCARGRRPRARAVRRTPLRGRRASCPRVRPARSRWSGAPGPTASGRPAVPAASRRPVGRPSGRAATDPIPAGGGQRLLVLGRRQQQPPDRRVCLPDLAAHRDTTAVTHVQVEHHHVRVQTADHADGLRGRPAAADDGDVPLVAEEVLQAMNTFSVRWTYLSIPTLQVSR